MRRRRKERRVKSRRNEEKEVLKEERGDLAEDEEGTHEEVGRGEEGGR